MSVIIDRVRTKQDVEAFINCQWDFYRDDPLWVPPLKAERRRVLDADHHPFYQHAARELFIAREGGVILGRLAAITNERHNETHGDAIGFFGFFECVDRVEVANMLFEAARSWLREQGKTGMRGPVNPSMNDECGLLVEGFDTPPSVMMTYNPDFYSRLIEGCGLVKVKDLYSYEFVEEDYESEKLRRLQAAIRERYKITVREVNFADKEQYARDLRTLKFLYNAVWEPNWGFVKMTDAEFDHLAKDLRQIADQRYALIAEVDGNVAGFILAVPDINQVLIHNRSGRLVPLIWHLLTKKKRISSLRTMVLGLLPEYRRTGADAVLYYEIGRRGVEAGIGHSEAGWVLEDNVDMNNVMVRGVNGKRFKTYRLYQEDW